MLPSLTDKINCINSESLEYIQPISDNIELITHVDSELMEIDLNSREVVNIDKIAKQRNNPVIKSVILRNKYGEQQPAWATAKLSLQMISFINFHLNCVSEDYYIIGLYLNIPNYILRMYTSSHATFSFSNMLHYWYESVSKYQETKHCCNIDYLLSVLESLGKFKEAENLVKKIQDFEDSNLLPKITDIIDDEQDIQLDLTNVPISFIYMAKSRKPHEKLPPWQKMIPHPMDAIFLLKILKDLKFSLICQFAIYLQIPTMELQYTLHDNHFLKRNHILQKWYQLNEEKNVGDRANFDAIIIALQKIDIGKAEMLKKLLNEAYELVKQLPPEKIENSIIQNNDLLIENFSIYEVVAILKPLLLNTPLLIKLLNIDLKQYNFANQDCEEQLFTFLYLWKQNEVEVTIDKLLSLLENYQNLKKYLPEIRQNLIIKRNK